MGSSLGVQVEMAVTWMSSGNRMASSFFPLSRIDLVWQPELAKAGASMENGAERGRRRIRYASLKGEGPSMERVHEAGPRNRSHGS